MIPINDDFNPFKNYSENPFSFNKLNHKIF